MFQLEDIERARRIVSTLTLPERFGEDDTITYDIERQLDDVVDEDFFVASGVSKAVIVVDSLPFVIKIPFNGYWDFDYEDEDGSPAFYEFTGASEYRPDDYCEYELEKTESLKDSGYGVFVPDMEYLCDADGYAVYIQMKVQPLYEVRSTMKPSRESLAKAKNYSLSFIKEWIALAIDFYGEEFWNSFIQWATENEPDVLTDMHTANYGLDFDGRPVLFDISGFRN